MQHWKFRLTCVNGGWGWGQTGAEALMCAAGNTEFDASEVVERQIPGGWIYTCIGKTEDTFYLKHTKIIKPKVIYVS